jgi:hypothetical protein
LGGVALGVTRDARRARARLETRAVGEVGARETHGARAARGDAVRDAMRVDFCG